MRTRRILASVVAAGALLVTTATAASASSGTVYSGGSPAYAKAVFADRVSATNNTETITVVDLRKDGASAVAQVQVNGGAVSTYRASDGVGSQVKIYFGYSDGDRVTIRACRQDLSAGGAVKDCGAWRTFTA